MSASTTKSTFIEEMKKDLETSKQIMAKLQNVLETVGSNQVPSTQLPQKTQPSQIPQQQQQQQLQQQQPQYVSQSQGLQGKEGVSLDKMEDELKQDDDGTRSGQPSSRRPASISMQRRMQLLAEPPKTLRDVLSKYLVEEVAVANWLRKRPVLIGDTQTIERALSRINAHEISSLPVVDTNKDVIGLIDLFDITNAISSSLKGPGFHTAKVRNEFMTKTVSSLFQQKTSTPFVVSNKTPLLTAAEHMTQNKQERLIIVDREVPGDVDKQTHPETAVYGLLTQTDIMRFLSQNLMLLRKEPIFQKTLKELNLGTRLPKIVYQTDIASEVFSELGELGCPGAAVVDQSGQLIANLSASDLKGITRRNCMVLDSTLENFLMKDRKRGWWVKPVTVDTGDTLLQTVLQFVCSRVHRMYLVDDDNKPIGEINHTDVLIELQKIR